MEKALPPWLNEDFLATVLQGGEEKEPQVLVKHFKARLAVAPGNNYLSHIFRVTVEYEWKGSENKQLTKSLMVKAPITKGIVSEMSDRMDVFGKELKTYKELLPKMNDKLSLIICPTLYYCPVKALILQDMKEEGYIMCDKYDRLDYAHCDLVVTTLAKFHAASVACYHDDPELIRTLGEENMWVEGDPHFETQMKPWFQVAVKTVAGIAAKMDGCQAAAEYLSNKVECIADSVLKMVEPKATGLNVLNHGDLWSNNMLFKHNDDEEVVDVKFIDFQILRYGSPALDLIYFLWTSSREEVREMRLEDLYHIYLETLNNTLEELGCEERLTEEEFRQDLKAATDWIIIAICCFLPMMQIESEDVLDMEEMTEEDLKKMTQEEQPDEKFMKMFSSKRYLVLLPSSLKQFYNLVSS